MGTSTFYCNRRLGEKPSRIMGIGFATLILLLATLLPACSNDSRSLEDGDPICEADFGWDGDLDDELADLIETLNESCDDSDGDLDDELVEMLEQLETDGHNGRSGIAITFDDAYIESWHAYRALFAKYGARASFMLTRPHLMTDRQVQQLQELQSDGHEIGCHTLTHVRPREFVAEHGMQTFIDEQILPALAAMREKGLEPRSFSYPQGNRSDQTDQVLLNYFDFLRTSGYLTPQYKDRVFHRWTRERLTFAANVDEGKFAWEDLMLAMDEAQREGVVLVVYAHEIAAESEQLHIKPENLEALMVEAQKRGLHFYTLPELQEQPGPEVIYSWMDEGFFEYADNMLDDIYFTATRFESAKLDWPLTWTEDPYGEKYWRFIFYSLRFTRHLLYAYRVTGDEVYRDKLVAILRSFVDKGEQSPYIDDKHTEAFLAMSLVNCYCKLSRADALDDDLKEKLQGVIYRRGEFLEKEEHFEKNNNHGVTEAAALLLIAVNFTGFDKAAEWRSLGIERLNVVLDKTVDDDGVQIEQSPFYHFYQFNFFWEIFHWDRQFAVGIGEEFESTINGMLRFASYVLLPDRSIPLIGSSKPYDLTIESPHIYSKAAEYDPAWRYVYTLGASGTVPAPASTLFPAGGWAFLRSSFGTTDSYTDQSQLIMDVGPFRTGHSHLDALSLHFYAQHRVLLADSGLYTYEEGEKHDYFFGTRAHNTVTVDGGDQAQGDCTQGLFETGDGWAYQSGSHALYDGVTHSRGAFLIGQDLVLVVDELVGLASHSYEQNWHLSPEAKLTLDGLSASVTDENDAPLLAIRQALSSGVTPNSVKGQASPYDGWVSLEYEEDTPAWRVGYTQEGQTAIYATLIAAGSAAADPALAIRAEKDGENWTLALTANGQSYSIEVHSLAGTSESVSVEQSTR